MSAEEAQSIVEEVEEASPEESFLSAFDDAPEEPAKEEPAEKETDTDVPAEPEPEKEEEAPEDKEVEEPAEKEEEEEEEELSALELAEKQASEKFLKKDEKKDEDKDEPADDEKEDVEKEAAPEIDFTDVDSDPTKFVSDLIKGKITDETKRARLTETLDTYPEIGEIAALVSRELAGRQTVKQVGGPEVNIPEDMQKQFEGFAEIQTQVMEMRQELSERRYFDAIEAKVPGARAIAGSDSFGTWLDAQSVGINTLASSGDSDDGTMVLKAYQEYETRSAAKKIDKDAGAKKKKIDASLKKSVKSSSSKQIDDGKDDFTAGFES